MLKLKAFICVKQENKLRDFYRDINEAFIIINKIRSKIELLANNQTVAYTTAGGSFIKDKTDVYDPTPLIRG